MRISWKRTGVWDSTANIGPDNYLIFVTPVAGLRITVMVNFMTKVV